MPCEIKKEVPKGFTPLDTSATLPDLMDRKKYDIMEWTKGNS